MAFDLPIPAVVRENQSLFLHIPKNAGTTVSIAMYGRHIGHRTALWYRRADKALFDSKFKFAIVRDPVDRFLSAFHYMMTGGTREVPASRRGTRLVRRCRSVMEFIEDAESGRLKDFKEIDSAFQQQSDYLVDEVGSLIVDHIFRLEDIRGSVLKVPGRDIDMRVVTNSSKRDMFNGDIEAIEKFVRRQYAADYRILESLGKPVADR